MCTRRRRVWAVVVGSRIALMREARTAAAAAAAAVTFVAVTGPLSHRDTEGLHRNFRSKAQTGVVVVVVVVTRVKCKRGG